MRHYIKEFRETGQLWRLALVENSRIIEMHCFDESGKEIETDLSKWVLNESGGLQCEKKPWKDLVSIDDIDDFAEIFILETPTYILERERRTRERSSSAIDDALMSENRALTEELRHMYQRISDLERQLSTSVG